MFPHPRLAPLVPSLLCAVLVLVSAAVAGRTPDGEGGLLPRRPLDAGPVRAAPLPPALAGTPRGESLERQLVLKMVDSARARATAVGGVRTDADYDLGGLRALARREGIRFEPLIRLPEGDLAALEARAAARSGRAQPDLAGLLVARLPGATVLDLERIGNELAALDEVEFVHVQTLGVPPPGDLAPPTPDLTGFQTYVAPDPGLDVDHARSLGYRGAGVRLTDCEYGWNFAHEDLVDAGVQAEPGQTVHPNVAQLGYDDHGTAVVGTSSAPDNGYGVTGVAPDASVHAYTEWSVEEGFRRATCIANALADSAFGDVVLLEMQTVGPGGDYAPAEVDPAIFTVVKAGTDAGVVVVAAAGNGAQDLDGTAYATWRSWGDSGAILVGAGTASAAHARLSFSTYGSRVDVQAWGQSVFTLGYGNFAAYGGDEDQEYTHSFSGTSSASGLVAPVCCLLQEGAEDLRGERLSSHAMRDLLVATGIPQGAGAHVGPFPDLEAGIAAVADPSSLLALFSGAPTSGDAPLAVAFADLSFGEVTSWSWDFGDGGSSALPNPSHVYETPGAYTVTLTVAGPAGKDSETKEDLVVVSQGFALHALEPSTVESLDPGPEQTVVLHGSRFTAGTTVRLDGVPVDPGLWTFVDPQTITLDMPQVATLGRHVIEVKKGAQVASLPIQVVPPTEPRLEVAGGVPMVFVPSSNGLDVTVAGEPNDVHFVVYSTQPVPSVVPGLVSLDLGDSFQDFDLFTAHVVSGSGWTAQNHPLSPGFILLFFQSLTLSHGRPVPVSNLQSVIITP